MLSNPPSSLPTTHLAFLSSALQIISEDLRILGVLAAGSYLTNSMDEFSDIDLVLIVEDSAYTETLLQSKYLAATLGTLTGAFTGEHVGEPRLLICLYDNPVLHVDLKFIKLEDLARSVEHQVVLWERDKRVSGAVAASTVEFPSPDPQWIEDRIWIWVHYIASKIGRGELFEAIDAISFIRGRVLGPLALKSEGKRPSGVRRIESEIPKFSVQLESTVASYNQQSCIEAITKCIELYRELRSGVNESTEAERVSIAYLDRLR